MALISPTNLLSLHKAAGDQTSSLQRFPSRRYHYASRNSRKLAVIPDPALFRALPNEDPGPKALPTSSECAVHLEMLEVFHALRHEVIQSKELDKAFGLKPSPRIKYRKKWINRKYVAEAVSMRDTTFDERRRLKWTYFLNIAATRFHQWIGIVDGCLKKVADGVRPPKYLLLPPVDVLVVWHAFLLNCDDFKQHCAFYNLSHVQDIVFPWAEIHAAIDSNTWKYDLPLEHSHWLQKEYDIDANLAEALGDAAKIEGPFRTLLSSFHNRGELTKVARNLPHPLFKIVRRARKSEKLNEAIVKNVERQCIFVDKMHAHRWIRSPAVEGTLRRAVDRYDKFLHLFHLYPGQFIVPTLDVDLVWHTHQCSSQNYRTFVTDRVGRFINHDDKIGRGTLDHGFTHAEQWYRLRFGEQYQVCLCWSCEAILSAVEELDGDVLDDDVDPPVADIVNKVQSKVHYYQEFETARRLERVLPIWNHR
ncbi:hypothetical protein BJX76DRAFT_348301 [Aspergillus varians]